MLPRGLKLFHADWIDDYDGSQRHNYVVGRTYDSAFNRWYKYACDRSYSFSYYFDEIDDEREISEFVEKHENIKADIYDWKYGYY